MIMRDCIHVVICRIFMCVHDHDMFQRIMISVCPEAQLECRTLTPSFQFANMGSLPEGTLCCYCGVNPAGYIPDGAMTMCFTEDDDSCQNRLLNGEYEMLVELRLRRLWKAMVRRLAHPFAAPKLPFASPSSEIELHIASYIWFV